MRATFSRQNNWQALGRPKVSRPVLGSAPHDCVAISKTEGRATPEPSATSVSRSACRPGRCKFQREFLAAHVHHPSELRNGVVSNSEAYLSLFACERPTGAPRPVSRGLLALVIQQGHLFEITSSNIVAVTRSRGRMTRTHLDAAADKPEAFASKINRFLTLPPLTFAELARPEMHAAQNMIRTA